MSTQTHTIVVEFPEGVSPRYGAGMEVLGGRVVAVAFDGNRLEAADQMQEALESIVSIANEEHFIRGANEKLYEARCIARLALTKAGAPV